VTNPAVMDGYIRVSRRLGREGPGYISPTVQREAIERWAEYKNVRIAEWHVDEDESGGTHERPGLELAVERALAGTTGGIVSWKIDRFSRYTEHGLRDLRRLQAEDARLVFVVEDIDTTGPIGKFVYTVMLAMSEYFLDSIKAGWRVAKARAVERGAHIGPTPYGYKRADDGTLEVDPECGPVVTDAFHAAARDGIPAALRLLDVRAPERTWTTTTVRRFLANRIYIGEIRYGPDMVTANAHEALVSRTVFEGAQHEATGQRRPSGDFPLSGVASCGTCGGRMVGARGGADNRRMYRCATRCDRPAVVSADLLEAHVVDVLRDQFEHQGFKGAQDSPDFSEAETALADAEAELDLFASDTTARRLLGHRYHQALKARVDAVEAARERLRSALVASEGARLVVPAELWDSLEPAELAEVLRAGLETVIVRRGRVPIRDRVTVVPYGFEGDAVPSPEDA
jgi:site-specific DNA recombinase